MRTLAAILLFPVRPGAAAEPLGPVAALAAPAPPLLLFLYLCARGCRAADAAAAASGLLLLVTGLGAGGALGIAAAARFVRDIRRRGLAVHLVFGAWAATLFLVAILVTGSALAGGLLVLAWGVFAGVRVCGARAETGRALVASCAGAGGALVGAVLGGLVAQQLVIALPAPGRADGVQRGDPLLVRPDPSPAPGALVLVRDATGRLSLSRGGSPEGAVGRVFFRLSGSWGGTPTGP